MTRTLAARRLASACSADDDLIFAGTLENARWARDLESWFHARRRGRAGFHALRHTAASRWVAAGVPVSVVSRLLGHATAEFTMRVYVDLLPSDLPDGDALAAAVGFT